MAKKSEQLDLQATMLAQRMKKIQERNLEKEKAQEKKEKASLDNDGQFMDNYLKMKNQGSSSKLSNSAIQKRPLVKKGHEPTIKKSRFANMLQQMKRTKQTNNASAGTAEADVQYVTATCFHDENSSSSDDDEDSTEVVKVKKSSTTATTIQQRAAAAASLQANFGAAKQPAAIISPTPSNYNPVGTIVPTSIPEGSAENKSTPVRTKPRKKRWGEKVDLTDLAPPGMAEIPGMQNPTPVVVQQPVSLGLPQTYRPVGLVGVTELSTAQRNQLEEQREMQNMYSLVMASRNAAVQMQNSASVAQKPLKIKHEYDSDEEIDEKGGTWEHQLRKQEMAKTQALAEKLTDEGDGKHFIGDFLPPAELEKFMETYKALKEGRSPDFSDYKEFKIQCDNIGFQMLAKMGWEEGQGLGSDAQGITQPVNKGAQSINGQGVGIERPDGLNRNDDDFSAYRKRMMLAYKFRPNPLNNPRRSYY